MHAVTRDRGVVLEAIYSLPVALQLRGCVSLMQLVRETGYPENETEIGVEEIRVGIADRAGLIAAWQDYSREKDANWGWFFEGPHRGIYLTGSRTRSLEGPVRTSDAAEACACFIKAELDSILGREVRLIRVARAG